MKKSPKGCLLLGKLVADSFLLCIYLAVVIVLAKQYEIAVFLPLCWSLSFVTVSYEVNLNFGAI